MPSITINCWDLPHYYGQFFVWLRFDVHLRIIVYVNYKIQSMTALSHYLAHDTAWHEIRLCNTCYVTPSNWPHPSWPARLMWKWFYLWSPVQDSSYIYSEIAALPVSGSMSGVWRNTISEIYKYIILHSSPRYDENFSQSISDTLGKSFCQKQCASIATNQPPNFPVTSLLTWTWVFKEEWKFLPGDLPVDSQTIYSYGRPIMEMFHTLPSINGAYHQVFIETTSWPFISVERMRKTVLYRKSQWWWWWWPNQCVALCEEPSHFLSLVGRAVLSSLNHPFLLRCKNSIFLMFFIPLRSSPLDKLCQCNLQNP